ncbi:unnamed protein product [Amoebophrya sp. A120]|nr:unnamed protein product [Amoebophrya sp. A120]|eukprot:GSA120T00001672001.1
MNSNGSAAMPMSRGGLPRVLFFLVLGSVFFVGKVQGRSQSQQGLWRCPGRCSRRNRGTGTAVPSMLPPSSSSLGAADDGEDTAPEQLAPRATAGGVDASPLLPRAIWAQVASFANKDAFALHKIFDTLFPGGTPQPSWTDEASWQALVETELEARWQVFYENLRSQERYASSSLILSHRIVESLHHQLPNTLPVIGHPYGLAAQLACYGGANGANKCRDPLNHAHAGDVLAAVERQGLHEAGRGPAARPASFRLHFLKLVDGALRRQGLKYHRTIPMYENGLFRYAHIHYDFGAPPRPPAVRPRVSAVEAKIFFLGQTDQRPVVAVGSLSVDCHYVDLSEDDLGKLGISIGGSAVVGSVAGGFLVLMDTTTTLSNKLVVTAKVYQKNYGGTRGISYRLYLRVEATV